jgi:diadenosine tetraphosphate (Ap4A) HIT family hydrolase
MSAFADFQAKFQVQELTIFRLEYWTWSTRPVHATLGSGILSLNRFCAHFGSLTTSEAAELAAAARQIESRLGRAFSPDKLNYLMLMMVDAHVHFHVIPRYSSPRDCGGLQWNDKGWPGFPLLNEGTGCGNETLSAIRDKLRQFAD